MSVHPSRRTLLAVLAGAGLALTACGSDSSSPATSSGAPASAAPASSSTATDPGSSSAASASATDASPAATGSGRTGACTDPDAKYCDDFADTTSGWPTQNTATGYTRYDPYLGGTYRIGLRGRGIVGQPAPARLTAISPTGSVQIDADVTVGQSSSNGTGVGFRCWSGTTGSNAPSGFQLLVNGTAAEIGLYSSLSGRYTRLKSVPFTGLRMGTTNRIAVQCLQRSGPSGVYAQLGMRVNDAPAISLNYAKSTRSLSWEVTDRMSLAAQGSSADVFFDNLSVSPVQV